MASPFTSTTESAGMRITVGLNRKTFVNRRSCAPVADFLNCAIAGVFVGSSDATISVLTAPSRTPKSSDAENLSGSTSVSRIETSMPRSPRSTRGAASFIGRNASSHGAMGFKPNSSRQSNVACDDASSLSEPLLNFSPESSSESGSVLSTVNSADASGRVAEPVSVTRLPSSTASVAFCTIWFVAGYCR